MVTSYCRYYLILLVEELIAVLNNLIGKEKYMFTYYKRRGIITSTYVIENEGLTRARSFLCSQSCVQFLRSNESAVLEAVGLVPSGESVEVFGEHGGANGIGGGNQCSAHYAMRSNSNPGVGAIQHAVGSNAAGALHHYPGAAHAPKRRASDTP